MKINYYPNPVSNIMHNLDTETMAANVGLQRNRIVCEQLETRLFMSQVHFGSLVNERARVLNELSSS